MTPITAFRSSIRLSRALRAAVAVIGLAGAGGCGPFHTSIVYPYEPSSLATTLPSVSLKVVNQRPKQHGGQTARVGRVRGGYGNPFPIDETDPANIDRAVESATKEALAGAGLIAKEGSSRTLVATIDEFWLDGFMAFKANVKVTLRLETPSAETLWQTTIATDGSSVMAFSVFEAARISRDAFKAALMAYSMQASRALQGADYRQAMGDSLQVAPGMVPTAAGGNAAATSAGT